jgi:hypothetical protein
MALTQADKLKMFIRYNNVDFEWRDIDGVRDVVAWINVQHIEAFCSIFGDRFFKDHDIDCKLQNKELSVCFLEICEHLATTLTFIFGKDPQS